MKNKLVHYWLSRGGDIGGLLLIVAVLLLTWIGFVICYCP